MDKLIVNGLELWLKVGCTAAERAFAQRIEVDFALLLDLAAAGEKDDLTKTVDYAEACALVKKNLTPRTFKLAEAVAEKTAEVLLKRFKVSSVEVRVKKRALPGIAWAAVEISRP